MKKFEELMAEAIKLEKMQNTEWAEEHADKYDAFAKTCENEYLQERLSAHEFNELIITALYDYPDLKEEYPFGVYMESGSVKHPLTQFETEEEAVRFCEENNWAWIDSNNFEWGLDYREV